MRVLSTQGSSGNNPPTEIEYVLSTERNFLWISFRVLRNGPDLPKKSSESRDAARLA
jgi:hypothetical protein